MGSGSIAGSDVGVSDPETPAGVGRVRPGDATAEVEGPGDAGTGDGDSIGAPQLAARRAAARTRSERDARGIVGMMVTGPSSRPGCDESRWYPPAMLSGGWRGGGGAARILIVDDDPNLLVLLADQLRNDGFEIQTARDGEEALRRLDGGWPDLLIVDMMMPRMDGLTLAREVKARADLPIIVLSAIDTADSKADLLEEVAEDYVTKPYHYPELRARIARVMRRLGDKVPHRELSSVPSSRSTSGARPRPSRASRSS